MDKELRENLYRPHSFKEHFPIYWSKIQKHYKKHYKSSLGKGIRKLSPRDLHRKWRVKSYNDEVLSSAVMKMASYVVSVSVFCGVLRLLDFSGVIIGWNDSNRQATILSSAKMMRLCEERDDYYFVVRLANGEILLAEEDYVDYYHNIVTFKVKSDVRLEPYLFPEGAPETADGVVVALGRDFCTCKLIESSGYVRKDYPYFGCELLISSTCFGSENREGGPLVTRMDHLFGINFFDGSKFVHPLRTSVIRSCLERWNSSGGSLVIRPWFGWTMIDIDQLPHDELETIATVSGDSTAVVKEVYKGSPADEAGVHPGDRVISMKKSLNKITISSASQYAQELSSISGELSAYPPDRTPLNIQVLVHGCDSHIREVVPAENLQVNDRRFCSCWLGDGPDPYLEPLFGSQTEAVHEIDAEEDGTDDNVSMYSDM